MRPAKACDAPTLPMTKTLLAVPASKVKVRSLLVALSALIASLNTIPVPPLGVAVTVTFAPSTTSPVTLKAPVPKLISPLKVLSALPVVQTILLMEILT